MYKIIDKKTGLVSCNISDPTAQMGFRKDLEHLKKNSIPVDSLEAIKYIWQHEQSGLRSHLLAYMYGQMQGKRKERARRKNK